MINELTPKAKQLPLRIGNHEKSNKTCYSHRFGSGSIIFLNKQQKVEFVDTIHYVHFVSKAKIFFKKFPKLHFPPNFRSHCCVL